MHLHSQAGLALALLCPFTLFAQSAKADMFTFDTVSGGTGTVAYPTVTFTGSQVQSAIGTDLATTAPNVYYTSDFGGVGNGSLTATFSSVGLYDAISPTMGNGFIADNFTPTAFDVGGTPITHQTTALNAYLSPGDVGSVSVSGKGIAYFTVTTNQPIGLKDLTIDTVELTPNFSAPAVPEPSPILAFACGALGLSGLVIAAKRRKTSVKASA